MKKFYPRRIDNNSSSGAFKLFPINASVISVAVATALASITNTSIVFAADSATDASGAGSSASKQIAAIESGKSKEKSVNPENSIGAGTAAISASAISATTTTSASTSTSTSTSNSAPASAATIPPFANENGTVDRAGDAPAPKLLLKKGQPLMVGGEVEDIQPTDDVELAKEQALHFPDSAEASFVLAVALTRTSRVEEALSEVRRARRLAQAQGGAVYFDKMIKSYEAMLQDAEDPRVRYSLAWAYYMKAYLLAQDSRRAMGKPPSALLSTPVAPVTAATAPVNTPNTAVASVQTATSQVDTAKVQTSTTAITENNAVPSTLSVKAEKKKVDSAIAMQLLGGINPEIAAKMSQAQAGKIPASQLPMIPTAIQKAAPSAVPQVHQYYAEALKNLDVVLAKKPDDVWALLYRWHLYAEDTGNLGEAMKQWKEAEHRFPGNPGVQLFLAEGYAKEGNLKEAIIHASKAVFLRGTGN